MKGFVGAKSFLFSGRNSFGTVDRNETRDLEYNVFNTCIHELLVKPWLDHMSALFLIIQSTVFQRWPFFGGKRNDFDRKIF